MDPLFVGADLGTSGVKVGVVDSEGRVLARARREAGLETLGPGRARQDADRLYSLTLDLIREVCLQAGDVASRIAAVAIDGQMGGVIGVDDDFEALTGLDMGLDTRAEAMNTEFMEAHGDRLFDVACGSPRNAPKIAWWKHTHPEVYARVRRFTTLGPYVAGRLAGLRGADSFIDETLIAFFGNEDAAARSWSAELTEYWGIDQDKLPRILVPTEVIGGVARAAASATGLPAGVPVVAGAGDQPAGFLGAGLMRPGSLVDVGGSSTLLCLSVPRFAPDTAQRRIVYMPGIVRDSYHATWYINGGGITVPWLARDVLGMSIDELSGRAAAVEPGAGGLLFFPYLGGSQCPPRPDVRGAFIGLNWGHRPAHLFRALQEGLAVAYAEGLERLEELFPEYRAPSMYATGGSAGNDLVAEIRSAVLGRTYRRMTEFDAAIRGMAIVAGAAVGVSSLDAAVSKAPVISTVTPVKRGLQSAYREVMQAYRGYQDYLPSEVSVCRTKEISA